MLQVLKYPDPRLLQKSQPVTQFDAALHRLLDEMAKSMYAENGVGLAAVQVGVHSRVFIVDISPADSVPAEQKQLFEFINPVLSNGAEKIVFEEGCLSLPGVYSEVTRKRIIDVEYQNRFGEKKRLKAEGLFAVALQHENDHLEGIVFIDRVSALKRQFLKRKIAKQIQL